MSVAPLTPFALSLSKGMCQDRCIDNPGSGPGTNGL